MPSLLSASQTLTLTACLLSVCSCHRAEGAETTPLVDLATSAQILTEDNFQATLAVKGGIPSMSDKDQKSRDLNITVNHAISGITPGWGSAPSFNQAKHKVDSQGLSMKDGTLSGTVLVTLNADRWVPADKQPVPLSLEIKGTVDKFVPDDEKPFTEAYWADPLKREGVRWKVSGTFKSSVEKWGTSSEGSFTGTIKLPIAKEKWTTGIWQDDAVLVGFDLGKKRSNWTKMKQTRLDLPAAQDLSKHGGLRLQIGTDTPREDAQISVWLQEADGSWYYYRNAVPLTKAVNTTSVLFSDFEEAEWVSPDGGASFMDEDFRLDLTQIKAIAIGVVNPHGIGTVQFAIKAIDLLGPAPTPSAAAKVQISGKTLSVNKHDLIPAGIAGGYHPDLPQQFRPGCQRQMITVPAPGARNPWASAVGFGGAIADGQALADEWLKDDGKLSALKALLSDKDKAALAKLAKAKKPKKEKQLQRYLSGRARTASKLLGGLLGRSKLYELAVFADDSFKDIREAIAALGPHQAHELSYQNRRLLDRYLGDLISKPLKRRPTTLFGIDCQGDRTQPATYLNNDSWEAFLTHCGEQFAKQSARYDYKAETEFWNEPYLDWQSRGLNYNRKFFREDLAKEGGPVTVKREDNPDAEEVIPHLVWYKRKGKKGEEWAVKDSSAFTYWSAKGNEFIYNRMLDVYAKAVKKTDPKVQVIAGWGMKWHEDHWAAWHLLFKPTIDKNIEFIDGLHEHHYQGNVLELPASYEVMQAYTMSKYNKWLYAYNTETTDLIDAPARGALNTPEKVAATKTYRVGSYNLRDMIYTWAQSPDKAKARTVIHIDHAPKATKMCYHTLRNLRGRLVDGSSDDRQVFVVASIDGTDPNNLPEDGKTALVAVVWNDHRDDRQVAISLQAPTGTTFAGKAHIEKPWQNRETFDVDFINEEIEATGTELTQELTIPGRSVWKITIPLTGTVTEAAEVTRTQYFAGDILQPVKAGTNAETAISLPDDALAAAASATLRIVLEHVAEGEGTLTINGTAITLPKAVTRDNGCLIVEIPVDKAILKTDNKLVYTLNEGDYAGYQVDMSSIVLTTVTN